MLKTIKHDQLINLIKEEIVKINRDKLNEAKKASSKPLNENEVRSLIKECLTEVITEHFNKKKNIKENVEHDDYGTISHFLAQLGWAYSDAYPVTNKRTGQQGTRYVLETYPNNLNKVKPVDAETLKAKLSELIGSGNIIFSEGQSASAPELRKLSMVVIGQ